jgi:pSer/pThr/pTyr-binding forkhead associated (FHA) protein
MGNKTSKDPAGGNTPAVKGVIVGVSGSYANASFDIENGAELSFGRDPQSVNIVLGATDSDVSRRHCKVSFDARTNQYAVTDLGSTTGTYLENGTKLTPNQTQYVARGSVIYLGSTKKNAFRLN